MDFSKERVDDMPILNNYPFFPVEENYDETSKIYWESHMRQCPREASSSGLSAEEKAETPTVRGQFRQTNVLYKILGDFFEISIKWPWYYDEEIIWDEPTPIVEEEVQQEVLEDVQEEEVQEQQAEPEHQDEQVGDSKQFLQGSGRHNSQSIPISIVHPEVPQPSLSLSTIPGRGHDVATAESSRTLITPELQELIS